MSQNLMKQLANIAAQPKYTPQRIGAIMKKYDLNIRGLAFVLNLSPYTVTSWLTGKVKPSSPSRRLLQMLELDSGIVERLAEEREGREREAE